MGKNDSVSISGFLILSVAAFILFNDYLSVHQVALLLDKYFCLLNKFSFDKSLWDIESTFGGDDMCLVKDWMILYRAGWFGFVGLGIFLSGLVDLVVGIFFSHVTCYLCCIVSSKWNLENGERARQANFISIKWSNGQVWKSAWWLREIFMKIFYKGAWRDYLRNKRGKTMAWRLTDTDANLGVDRQASNLAILSVFWGTEENWGHPFLLSHPKLDCAHGGDVI